MEKELKVNRSSERPTRVPVGQRNRINVRNRDPNYHYRYVNVNLESDPDRVQRFLDGGYEIVDKDSVRVGDKRVNSASSEGSVKQISVGQGQKGFVVRIRKEWYEEDQLKKQRQVNELERATKEKALDGTYGKLEITRD